MGKTACDIRIGTSGWHYDHWSGLFYPDKLAKSRWFEYYAEHFDTVEINSTFYHQPKEQTFINWYKKAPKNFLFTVKMSRFITHIKKLKDTQEPLGRFFEGAKLLKDKFGPVLYQLPPSLHKDLDRLKNFIQLLPRRRTAIFEFRHESWYSDDIFELLDASGVGFCIHDMPGKESPRIVTGGIIYVRFHGSTSRYSGNYSQAMLKNWANWINKHNKNAQSVFAYFNNDDHAYAVYNAKALKEQFH